METKQNISEGPTDEGLRKELIEELDENTVQETKSKGQFKNLDFLDSKWIPQKVRKHKKIGRNDPCPCGSGKKYKKCCLGSGKYEGYKEVK